MRISKPDEFQQVWLQFSMSNSIGNLMDNSTGSLISRSSPAQGIEHIAPMSHSFHSSHASHASGGLPVIVPVDALGESEFRVFSFQKGGVTVEGFVIKYQGEFYAYINRCPHTAEPLDGDEDGVFNATRSHLICDEHSALFNPKTGICVSGPCPIAPLTKIPITVENGNICLLPF